MIISRPRYLKELISYMWDGQIKVITGIRRCGKSFLLHNFFKDHLLNQGVPADHILTSRLDAQKDLRYRNPLELGSFVRDAVEKSRQEFYLFVDEIQESDVVPNPYNAQGKPITFYDALNDLNYLPNLDIYVTGSNSRMLSSEVLTEFRGRSDEIRMHPLSFSEFWSSQAGDLQTALEEFALYGGMPLILSRPSDAAKTRYLKSLLSEVYLKDIVERGKIRREDVLGSIVDLLCSSIGSLTNFSKIARALNSSQKRSGENLVSMSLVKSYMDRLEDAFLFRECRRFDLRGKRYFEYPSKYYCEDLGLRNARLDFRQQEMPHIMENIVFNELVIRGLSVDVGAVASRETDAQGKIVQTTREIDFVASSGGKKAYVQSAFALGSEEKAAAEIKPLTLVEDYFPRIIIRQDIRKRWYNEQGILNIGLADFLLDDSVI